MDMADKKIYLSKEKHAELKNELDFLMTTRRGEIARELEEAKSFGDLSENAEYHQAREAQAAAEDRINQLEDMLEFAEIVAPHKSSVAEVGTTVIVRNETTKEEKTFELVGSEEVDMKKGRISPNSPLGSSIIGKKKDQVFEFKAPSGTTLKYKVLKIA